MDDPQVTFVIAIAPYHREIAQRAIESAEMQDVDCAVITAYDENMRGAGVARNAAVQRVETRFTVFLDADDWIEPHYVSHCLSAWETNKYVYTDWYEDTTLKIAPDCPYTNKTWHPITTLIPTDWLRRVGGFDESLAGAEDTHLYLKLLSEGCCGKHLGEPLFHYGSEGRRAREFIHSPAYHATMNRFTNEFGSKHMSCCGANQTLPQALPEGEPDDVTVLAIWSGNQQKHGPVTGRLYERTGNGKMTKVDPRDLEAAPHWWRLVEPKRAPQPTVFIERAEPAAVGQVMPPLPEAVEGVNGVAQVLFGMPAPWSYEDIQAVKPAEVKPDVGALARLTRRG